MQNSNLKCLAFGFLGAGCFSILSHCGPAFAQVQSSLVSYIKLQASTPGTPQIGHANISGTMIAGQFKGDGAAVTNVDAAKLGGVASAAFGQILANNSWTGVNNFANSLNSFAGSGTQLTGLNASSLASGTVPNARLTVGGDLSGPLSTATVSKIQGRSVDPTFPNISQVLGYDGAAWKPIDDSLKLPYSAATSDQLAFAITNIIGDGIQVFAISGGRGIVGASGSLAVLPSGTGVIGYSDTPLGFGTSGQVGSNAIAAGRFVSDECRVILGGHQRSVETNGFVWREYTSANFCTAVPIAYGVVSALGSTLSGTGNFTVTHPSAGQYDIAISGQTYSNNTYVVTVTPVSNSDRHACVADPGSAMRVNMFNQSGVLTDNQFQFTVWTQDPAGRG